MVVGGGGSRADRGGRGGLPAWVDRGVGMCEREEMKTILLTGATGFLGSEVLRAAGFGVRVVPVSGRVMPAGGLCVDLRDGEAVGRMMAEVRPDAVIHCAAVRDPDVCEAAPEESARLNVGAVGSLLRGLAPESRFVFVSTDYVFDGGHPPYAEGDAVGPVNVYGRQKVEAEALVRGHANHLIVRIPVLVGEAENGFLQQMLREVRSGEEREVDDVLVRHPLWTRDAARALWWLLEEGREGLWHVSSRRGGTRYALTRRVADWLGVEAVHLRPSTALVPRRALRPLDSALSPAKYLAAGGPAVRELEELLRILG